MTQNARSPVMRNYDPAHDTGPVPSPCINVCNMIDSTGLCEGCFRNLDEIVAWGSATEATKRMVWMEIRRRQDALW